MILVIGLIILLILLLLTIFSLLTYCGLFESVDVKVGPSPVTFSGKTVIYKTARGDYSKSGHLFTELTGDLVRVHPNASDLIQIGFFYDDPTKKKTDRLRYAAGAILPEEGDHGQDLQLNRDDIVTGLQAKDYKTLLLPVVDHVVHTSFPNRGPIAIAIAARKVYPVISAFITEHKLCAHPALEIYTSDYIHFIWPLSKQDSFYVFDEDEGDSDVDEESSHSADDGSGEDEDIGDAAGSESESDRCSNSEADHEEESLLRKRKQQQQHHLKVNAKSPDDSIASSSGSQSRKASSDSSFEEILVPDN